MSNWADAAVTLMIVSSAYPTLRLAVFGYIVLRAQRKAPPESQVEIIKASAQLGRRLPDSGTFKLLTDFRRR